MQQKILFGIFALLLIGVGILLGALVLKTNVSNISTKTYYHPKTEKKSILKNEFTKWTKRLSDYQKGDYMLPINELFITVNFPKKSNNTTVKQEKKIYKNLYRLVVDNLSNYSLFCIMQIFNKKDTPYILTNDNENSCLYVRSEMKEKLVELQNELKRYDIVAKIEKE